MALIERGIHSLVRPQLMLLSLIQNKSDVSRLMSAISCDNSITASSRQFIMEWGSHANEVTITAIVCILVQQ